MNRLKRESLCTTFCKAAYARELLKAGNSIDPFTKAVDQNSQKVLPGFNEIVMANTDPPCFEKPF